MHRNLFLLLAAGALVLPGELPGQARKSYTLGLVAKSQGNPVFQAARVGALDAARELGARHGIFCVGCCWALMLVMFAVGAANLVWMAVLAALMVHEKTRPLGARAVPITGMALLGVASVTLIYSAWAAGIA